MTKSKSNFDEFKEAFLKEAKENIKDFTPILDIDSELNVDQIDFSLVHDLSRLEPFGPGNQQPIFLANDLKILDKRDLGKHLKLKLKGKSRIFNAIGFNMSENFTHLTEKIDVAFNPIINNFNNEKSLELKIVDLKIK